MVTTSIRKKKTAIQEVYKIIHEKRIVSIKDFERKPYNQFMKTKNQKQHATVITGAGSGIGRATATALTETGVQLALIDINTEAVEETAELIEKKTEVLTITADCTDSEQLRSAAIEVRKRFSLISTLICSAGRGAGGTVLEIDELQWQHILDADLKSAYLSCRHFLPLIIESGGGSVVHISSIGGLRGNWGGAAFTSAKAGLIGLTLNMAVAHARENVRTNCICPGVIETPLTQSWLSSPETRKHVISRHPIGRLGSAEEVASVIRFLAGPEASFVNGAVIPVDGGALAMGQ
jgi:NAD(P)-dependent dehydrogenase (short-subunit alcohol dehydrogenase family)